MMYLHSFEEKLTALIERQPSPFIVRLAPRLERLPLSIQRFDEPLLPFGKAMINATHALVIGYSFDLAAYLRFGAAGAIALERTIDYAAASGDAITILHGGFALDDYAILLDENSFGVDAVTITRSQITTPFVVRKDRGVFVITGDRDEPFSDEFFNAQVGVYDTNRQLIEVLVNGQKHQISILNDILYRYREDDFVNRLRSEIERMTHA